ncbi:MAG TPA: GntR family transcriptional regulator [Bacillales bacterium]|nr:GntR family transcriptional regulator [Bacillales bacterium]
MIIELDLESETPIYLQLKQQIIEGIALGELEPGEPLPSVRALASDLGINMHTVNKAYQLLKQDGYILIHRQKGVVIHPDGMPEADETFNAHIKNGLKPLITESMCRHMDEKDFLQMCQAVFEELRGKGQA